MKRKIGISTFELQKKFGDEEAIKIAKEVGADAIDFDLGEARYDYRNPESIYSKNKEEFIEYFSKLKAICDELEIEVCQTHGRGYGFRGIKEEDDALIKNAYLDCLATKILGAPYCVIHSVTTIFMGPDAKSEDMHRLNFEMFSKIIPFAKEFGIKIASETFGDATGFSCCDFFGNIDEFVKSFNDISAIEDFKDYFCTCVDTGHSNKAMRFSNPTPGDVIRRLGKTVEVLHLNDNDTLTDQHKIPMTGCIDWEDVFDALDEIGYSGVYNMELVLSRFGEGIEKETASYAVTVMRNLLERRYGK